jgi:hypothetical protein
MRRLALVALLLATVLVIAGCEPTLRTETGVVTSVTSTSLVDIDGFQLCTADGRVLTFSTKGLAYGQGFPPQHLREHQALAQAVEVTYKAVDGANVVVKLQDAPTR